MRQVCLSACSCLPLLPQRHSPTCLWGCLGGGWVENPPFSTEAAELGTWEVLMPVGMLRSCPNASVRGQGARRYLVGPVSQLEGQKENVSESPPQGIRTRKMGGSV